MHFTSRKWGALSEVKRLKILLLVCSIFNIALVCSLVFPGTYYKYFEFLNNIAQSIQFKEVFTSPNDMVHVLFINTVGIDVILISVFNIYSLKNIFYYKNNIGFYIVARMFLFCISIYYFYSFNFPALLILVCFLDMMLIFLMAYYFYKAICKSPHMPLNTDTDTDSNKNITNFKKLLKFSGLFNIVCAAPLTLPCTCEAYLSLLNYINLKLNLGGTLTSLPQSPLHAFFINVAGVHLVLTGIIIIHTSKSPEKNYPLAIMNGIGRTLFFFIILYLTYTYSIACIWLFFGLIDLLISCGFIFYSLKIINS